MSPSPPRHPPPIDILPHRCKGCTRCVDACPFGAISLVDGKAVIDLDACTLCGACVSICRPFEAIVMRQEAPTAARSASRSDVWVYGEMLAAGGVTHATVELLGRARRLADELGVSVGAVLLGADPAQAAAEVIGYGADAVYCAAAPELERYCDEPFAKLLAAAIARYRPDILLGAATAVGRALLPRVAVLAHTGLTADCTELAIDPASGLLLQTRPAFGGNILATIQCPEHRPQMATVRPGVLPMPAFRPERQGRIVDLPVSPSDLPSALTWLESRRLTGGAGELREAEVVVTAGAGVGGIDGVKCVERLAQAVGGVLGGSRAMVDAGWIPYRRQVGQTGQTVQPKMYIACGVSGAIQHVVGMQNSELVVAINRDPEAPIFNFADVAVVGDVLEIVPALLRRLERNQDHAK